MCEKREMRKTPAANISAGADDANCDS